jgi:hypothetical protein
MWPLRVRQIKFFQVGVLFTILILLAKVMPIYYLLRGLVPSMHDSIDSYYYWIDLLC